MKAIILAAGMGKRLGKYTADLPKCMLTFRGETLLERQIRLLRSCGITDISVVTGYQAEKIDLAGIKYYRNTNFSDTNMVESLFCAERELVGESLIAYSDILYEKKVIEAVAGSDVDIGVAVDDDYFDYWQAKLDGKEGDMESLVIQNGDIIELGSPCENDKAEFRYVGLIRLSSAGSQTLRRVYEENRASHYRSGEPWFGSRSFRQAYMTSLLQAVIDSGHKVKPIIIHRGWLEFDTVTDYEKAEGWAADGSIKRFIQI